MKYKKNPRTLHQRHSSPGSRARNEIPPIWKCTLHAVTHFLEQHWSLCSTKKQVTSQKRGLHTLARVWQLFNLAKQGNKEANHRSKMFRHYILHLHVRSQILTSDSAAGNSQWKFYYFPTENTSLQSLLDGEAIFHFPFWTMSYNINASVFMYGVEERERQEEQTNNSHKVSHAGLACFWWTQKDQNLQLLNNLNLQMV